MERALKNSLDDEERLIIEKKYLTAARMKDINIYMELGMKKDTYYEIKQRAILRIATAFGIICVLFINKFPTKQGANWGLFMFGIPINLTYQQNTGDAPNPYQWRIWIRNKGVEE